MHAAFCRVFAHNLKFWPASSTRGVVDYLCHLLLPESWTPRCKSAKEMCDCRWWSIHIKRHIWPRLLFTSANKHQTTQACLSHRSITQRLLMSKRCASIAFSVLSWVYSIYSQGGAREIWIIYTILQLVRTVFQRKSHIMCILKAGLFFKSSTCCMLNSI